MMQYRHFPHMFIEECETEPEDAVKELSLSPLPVLEEMPRSVIEEFVAGKLIHFNKNLFRDLINTKCTSIFLISI